MVDSSPQDATVVLQQVCQGEQNAVQELTPLVYEELKAIAIQSMQNERQDHTLQPTALVNEAYLRLINQDRVQWQGKAHFCAIAAKMMRRILISHARSKAAEKRGADAKRIPLLEELLPASVEPDVDLLELEEILEELHKLNPRHARVVELRFFAGMTIQETAVVMGQSDWSVKNDWRIARAWLMARLNADGVGGGPFV